MRLRAYFLIFSVIVGIFILLPVTSSAQSDLISPLPSPTPSPSTMPKGSIVNQDDLRVLLNSLLKEHVYLSTIALEQGYDQFGSDKFKAATKSLDDNSIAVAKTLDAYYLTGSGDQFLEAWRNHIDAYFEYMMAVKNNNAQLKDQAKQNLANSASQMADILSSSSNILPQNSTEKSLTDQGDLIVGIIDSYAAGDYDGVLLKTHTATGQVGEMADSLANAISKLNPNIFSRENSNQLN